MAGEATDEAAIAAVESKLAAAAEAGALDEAIARLEAAAARADSRPGIHLALSAAYGRKGLIERQYAALAKAEAAAKAPGIVFSLAAIYGRKELLASDPRASLCRLSITSDPPGAAISIDGSASGAAPAVAIVSALEEHRVQLSLPNYEGFERSLRLEPAAAATIAAALKPMPDRETARISLSAGAKLDRLPAGTELLVDGKVLGSYPYSESMEIPAGMHEVAARAPGYAALPRNVDCRADTAQGFPFLSLAARIVPNGRIKLDGERDDWSDIAPLVEKKGGPKGYKSISGTDLIAGYCCEDDSYLYWLMVFGNGRPSFASSSLQRTLYIHCDPPKAGYAETTLQLSIVGSGGAAQAQYNYYSFKSRGKGTPTYHTKSTAAIEYRIGADLIEARVKLTALRQCLVPGKGANFEFWVYDDPKDRSERLENMAVFF